MLAIEEIEQLTPANLSPLTVLTGDDVGQFELMKSRFLEQIAFDPADLNYTYFDVKETAYQELELDLVSLPFFADEKIVILDHFSDLTTSKKRFLTDEELQSFESYLKAPLETTKLVIFAEGKLDSKRRLVKLLKRDGQIFEAAVLKEQDLRSYFTRYIKEQGLNLSVSVFEQLLLKSGFQFGELTKNIAFLKDYKGNASIELADIDQAIPKTLQDNIFDLTQFVLKGQIDAARVLVRDLTLQGEDEVKLLAIMLGQFRTYAQVRLLADSGRTEQQIVSDLSDFLGRKVNPYQIKFALRDSRNLCLDQIKTAMMILIETDFQIKSGVYDKDYLLDMALLKIASKQ